MPTKSMLTTVDNPHDPFNNYDDWTAWDERQGYHTQAFLSRVAVVSDDLSEADYDAAVEHAIDEIVEENILGLYRKVTRIVPDSNSESSEDLVKS